MLMQTFFRPKTNDKRATDANYAGITTDEDDKTTNKGPEQKKGKGKGCHCCGAGKKEESSRTNLQDKLGSTSIEIWLWCFEDIVEIDVVVSAFEANGNEISDVDLGAGALRDQFESQVGGSGFVGQSWCRRGRNHRGDSSHGHP
jgi:hypothetical protein